MATNGEDYPVGYGKPRRDSQFKKGRSGNPSGRPRGSRNWDTLIYGALEARVVVHKDGRRKTITKREAIAIQLVNKAVSGDLRSVRELLARQQGPTGQPGEFPIGPDGKPVITIVAIKQILSVLGRDSDSD